MTTEALASLKVGVVAVTSMASGAGAVLVADAGQTGAMSPGIVITSMIITALAPVIAVVVMRLKTAAELKEIHVAVNSLAAAKDAKVEALDRKIDTMSATILLLTSEKATQAQQIVAHEKTDIKAAAAKDALLTPPEVNKVFKIMEKALEEIDLLKHTVEQKAEMKIKILQAVMDEITRGKK